VKAYQILDSVVCGEIPVGTFERIMEKHPNAVELMSVQAGQVRCVVSDLRTSAETAALQRCAAVTEHQDEELQALEQNVSETHKVSTDAEVAYTRALQE
jgi:CRP-like cAMP-binding protein